MVLCCTVPVNIYPEKHWSYEQSLKLFGIYLIGRPDGKTEFHTFGKLNSTNTLPCVATAVYHLIGAIIIFITDNTLIMSETRFRRCFYLFRHMLKIIVMFEGYWRGMAKNGFS